MLRSSRFFIRFNRTRKAALLLTVMLFSLPAFCVYGASLVTVTLTASSSSLLYFESNAPFWDPSWADVGTALVRISEPNSINGDGKTWQVTLTDTLNGTQKFSFIAWALQHLNVSSVTHLVLYVRGGSGGETFEVGLRDFASPAHEIRINVAPFITGGGAITTNYKQIRIPLTEFLNRGVVLSDLDLFLIISTAPDGQNITIYLDAMGFE